MLKWEYFLAILIQYKSGSWNCSASPLLQYSASIFKMWIEISCRPLVCNLYYCVTLLCNLYYCGALPLSPAENVHWFIRNQCLSSNSHLCSIAGLRSLQQWPGIRLGHGGLFCELVRLLCVGSFPVMHKYFFSLVSAYETPGIFWVLLPFHRGWGKGGECFKFTGYENYLGAHHKPSAKKPWQVAFSCFMCTGKTCFHAACSHGCFFFSLFNFWNFEQGICAWSTACSSQWSVPILMAFISTVNELC